MGEQYGKILKILSRLLKELRGDFAPEVGFSINKTEFIALMELRENPHRPMKHYMRVTGIESGSFTYLADELEKKGFIRRVAAADDKRMTELELTARGQETTGKLRRQFDAHVAGKIACLDEDEIISFKTAMTTLEDILKKLETQHGKDET